jgi:tetratricopeptide (TPR) repeat protein
MPYTVNGIGTWYYGKRRVHTHLGRCGNCGVVAPLKSYDTTLFFVILYIPLVPLGGRRIFEDCPSCGQHRVLGLRAFERQRAKATQEATQRLKAAPQDPEAALHALQVMITFQNRKAFESLAPAAEVKFATHRDVHLAIGEGYAYFEDFTEAADSYQRALAIADGPETRERLAVFRCRAGEPEKAHELLRPYFGEAGKAKKDLLYLLVESYQAQARHPQAMEVLDRIAEAFPEDTQKKDFKDYRKKSARNAPRGRAVRYAHIGRSDGDESAASWYLPRFLGLALVILAAIGYLVAAWYLGRSSSAYLVGGLPKSYEVRIAGETYHASNKRATEVRIPEGPVLVEVIDPAVSNLPPVTVEFHTPFLRRPFDRTVRVINPDGIAVLLREQTVYSVAPDRHAPPLPYQVYCGRTQYEVPPVNYVFRKFPKTIELPSESAKVTKTAVGIAPFEDPVMAYPVLKMKADGADLKAFTAHLVRLFPDSYPALTFAGMEMEPDAYVAFLREGLQREPRRIEWHRAYQHTLERQASSHDLLGEYRALYEAHPGEPMYAYLLGRLTEDQDEADKLYVEAESGPAPIGYGYNAMAYHRLCAGAFEEAYTYASKAAAVGSERNDLLFRARVATHRYDEVIQEVRESQEKDPRSGDLARLVVLYADLAGRTNEAAAEIRRWISTVQDEMGTQELDQWRAYFRAAVRYARQDSGAFIAEMNLATGGSNDFQAAVVRGDAAGAAAACDLLAEATLWDKALVALLAGISGEQALSDRFMASFLAELREQDKDGVRAADWIEGTQAPSARAMRDLTILPHGKRFVLLALALRHPSIRAEALDQAAQLNAWPEFPQHELATLMARLR